MMYRRGGEAVPPVGDEPKSCEHQGALPRIQQPGPAEHGGDAEVAQRLGSVGGDAVGARQHGDLPEGDPL